jgi:hypothetical protein
MTQQDSFVTLAIPWSHMSQNRRGIASRPAPMLQ